MATAPFLDKDGATVNMQLPLAPGRAAAAASRPVSLSTEDKAALDAVATQITAAAILTKIIAAPATEAKQDAAIVQETAINTVLGTTAGTAVTTNATGTIQQYLRGIVSLLVSGITVATHAVTQSGTWVISAGTALIGKVGIDQTTDGTTNKVAADVRLGGVAASTGSGAMGTGTQRVAMATDSPGIIAVGTAGTPSANVVTMQGVASMTPVATVGKTVLFPVTLSASTGAQAVGTLIADTQVLTSLFRVSDGTGILNSIQVIDQDDNKQAIDFYFVTANVSLGTEGSAVSITDANALELVGPFSIAAADYKDLGGVSVAKITGLGQAIKANSGTADGYIAAVCASGTPTYTASGIKIRLGVLLD